jgi:voltage-gated potassium channel
MLTTAQKHEQNQVLCEIEDRLETPMFVLSLIWSALLVVDLIWGSGPAMSAVTTIIWLVFIAEYIFRFVVAPRKMRFLRKSWVTLLALALPALRVVRIGRVAYLLRGGRAVRGLTLARVFAAFNRGFRSLQRTMGQFAFGYVMMLTVLVTLLGSAGMYTFERSAAGERGLNSFGDALWFTAMMMTTCGSDYWPQSAEGRVLCFFLAVYAFTIFGYVTATLATLLIRPHEAPPRKAADPAALRALRDEIAGLRQELRSART